ncbi:MAG: hypothetical protein ACYCV5_06760, partial [Acidimicrobiales bacterium]
ATRAGRPAPAASWHKPPSRWRRPPWGRPSGRTRRSGRRSATRALRLRLAELAGVPIPAESEERIAETQAYRCGSVEQWHHV